MRVLIETVELEKTSAGGIILATTSQSEREEMANTTGVVVAMGEEAHEHINTQNVQVGDNIIFAKFAGLLYTGKDGKKYRVINSDNVVAKLDGEVKIVDPHLKKGL